MENACLSSVLGHLFVFVDTLISGILRETLILLHFVIRNIPYGPDIFFRKILATFKIDRHVPYILLIVYRVFHDEFTLPTYRKIQSYDEKIMC